MCVLKYLAPPYERSVLSMRLNQSMGSVRGSAQEAARPSRWQHTVAREVRQAYPRVYLKVEACSPENILVRSAGLPEKDLHDRRPIRENTRKVSGLPKRILVRLAGLRERILVSSPVYLREYSYDWPACVREYS